ncbi:MAG: peptidoglycan-associated lipoprotein Pal [Onishia taeanensis]|uniref:peptidoglycan-associated lipoprotein Pal n=1 Tax=Onishia taeanensis TaxID=284577 RepID=UPI003C7C78A7
MHVTPYAKHLAVAVSLVIMAGCSSTGGTQDGSMAGSEGAAGTSGGASSQGMNAGQVGSSSMGMRDGQQDGIPQVRTIYFDYDRDTIRSEFEPVMAAHAQFLRSHPNANVVLQGHTDERGTREYNLALGERRANAVQRFLMVQGVSPSQLEVVSYGEERPAVRGSSEDSYAQNRRVVFDY